MSEFHQPTEVLSYATPLRRRRRPTGEVLGIVAAVVSLKALLWFAAAVGSARAFRSHDGALIAAFAALISIAISGILVAAAMACRYYGRYLITAGLINIAILISAAVVAARLD